jgi:RND family efflux transporter MFP subunit
VTRGRQLRFRGLTGETTPLRKIGTAAAALFGIALAAGCGGQKTNPDDPAHAPHVAVVKVERRNIASHLEISSEFLPFQEIEVYAKVSGYVQKLDVDWGTRVKKGQLLAVLEIPELQQQLQQDEAAVHRSEQDLSRTGEELNRAQSSYKVAHLTYSRIADVQKTQPGLVAQQEVDEAQGKDLEGSADVSAAKDALAASEQGLLASKAALAKDKAMYDYARITAPFDGVVTEVYAYTGALLPAGTSSNKGDLALCRLSQNDLLRLVIPVPERAVADVQIGQKVDVSVSSLGRDWTGVVARTSGQIDTQTRTMHTEVSVPNPKYELVPGMYASVKIPLHSASNVLVVPVQAAQSAGEGRATVLIVNAAHRIERHEVRVGLQTASDVEIETGLQEGDLVVFGELSQYKEGELVVPEVRTPAEVE